MGATGIAMPLDLLRELQKISGANDKQMFLRQHMNDQGFLKLLYYAVHPLLTYKVSEATLRGSVQYDPAITLIFTNIFEVCEKLSGMNAIDDVTLYQVKAFLSGQNEQDKELYVKLLSKTLRLGVTAATVNKAIPGLFQTWGVQQAYPIEKHPLKDGAWFAVTQKLNGVRATFYNGSMIGRSGLRIDGLSHIERVLSNYPDLVFDGVLTLLDKSGLSDFEAFRKAAGIINSDDDKTVICFTIFDMLPRAEFEAGESKLTYSVRRDGLDAIGEDLAGERYVSVLPVLYKGTDQSVIPALLERMVSEDKEGLMVNLDTTYKCRRHSGILKVKRFYTMDLPIIGFNEGTSKLSGTLGAIVVDFNGVPVSVGSGFTDEERSAIWSDRDKYLGVLAEVKYKEISQDKSTGDSSLQFPVFVSLRTDKSDVSFG